MLKVPESPAELDGDDFETVLIDELDQESMSLPLERFCSHGGRPDDDSLKFEVDEVEPSKDRTKVTIRVWFDEISPTGCADIKHHSDSSGTFDIWFNRSSNEAYIELDNDGVY